MVHLQVPGFDLHHTGGGCTALLRVLPDGREVLITDGEAEVPRADAEKVTLSVYLQGEQVSCQECTISELTELLSQLEPPQQQTNFRMDVDLIPRFQDALEGSGMSKSALINLMIRDWLNEFEADLKEEGTHEEEG